MHSFSQNNWLRPHFGAKKIGDLSGGEIGRASVLREEGQQTEEVLADGGRMKTRNVVAEL
jgi:hypothetical protein